MSILTERTLEKNPDLDPESVELRLYREAARWLAAYRALSPNEKRRLPRDDLEKVPQMRAQLKRFAPTDSLLDRMEKVQLEQNSASLAPLFNWMISPWDS